MAFNIPGGFDWGTGGARWAGVFEDPRFLKHDDCRIVATEIERRPHIGPAMYKLPELEKGFSVHFAPPPGSEVDRMTEARNDPCSLATEVARDANMGPAKYDTMKYDAFPQHGSKAPTLAPWPPTAAISKKGRFEESTYDRLEAERKANAQFIDLPSAIQDKCPQISVAHRFTPREEWKVPSPQRFLKGATGLHFSQVGIPGARNKRQRRHMVPIGSLRSASVPPPMERTKADDWLRAESGQREDDRWRGLGPYLGYKDTFEYRNSHMNNFAKCGIASVVPRTEDTAIGMPIFDYGDPSIGPGHGFDESDQAMAERNWGRYFAWERWKIQSKRGQPPGYVDPLVQQAQKEKKTGRRRTKDPYRGTIQSQWHGKLQDAVFKKDDWACRPKKFSEIRAEEEAAKEKKAKTKSDASTPAVVSVKATSDAVIENMSL